MVEESFGMTRGNAAKTGTEFIPLLLSAYAVDSFTNP